MDTILGGLCMLYSIYSSVKQAQHKSALLCINWCADADLLLPYPSYTNAPRGCCSWLVLPVRAGGGQVHAGALKGQINR